MRGAGSGAVWQVWRYLVDVFDNFFSMACRETVRFVEIVRVATIELPRQALHLGQDAVVRRRRMRVDARHDPRSLTRIAESRFDCWRCPLHGENRKLQLLGAPLATEGDVGVGVGRRRQSVRALMMRGKQIPECAGVLGSEIAKNGMRRRFGGFRGARAPASFFAAIRDNGAGDARPG